MKNKFDYFTKEKSDFLRKKDKSKKGHIDKAVVRIINEVNSKKDYCTTSSCSGRIVLLEKLYSKKNEAKWLFVKHDKIKINEIIKTLKNSKEFLASQKSKGFFRIIKNKNKNEIWFKQEPIILHVRCRNIDAAKKFLDASRKIFKRAGIISLGEKKIIIEVIGSERIDTIIADKDFIADENYLKELIKYANKNFEDNKEKGERFLKVIEKI